MRISNKLLSKLQRLHHMRYTIAEIAEELHTPESTVRYWISHEGAPHQKDQCGRIWIVGTELRRWILAQHKEKKAKKHTLDDNEFWCLLCGMPVKVENPQVTPVKPSGLFYRYGNCPSCGTQVFRGGVKHE